MKKIILFVTLINLGIACYSQRYEKIKDAQFAIGLVNNGISIDLSAEKHISGNLAYGFDLGFFNAKEKVINTPTINAKFMNFHLAPFVKYYYDINNIYLFVGAGATGGYEFYTNKKDVPDNIKMERKNQLIYGFIGYVGIEYNFTNYAIVLSYSPIYEMKKKDFINNPRIGIKYLF